MSNFKKNSDEPIVSLKEDRFGRENFSHTLADALIKVPNNQSMTVGLYGTWGSGKTSIINIAKEYLNSKYENDVIIVEFNPWIFSSVESLHMAFFNSLAVKLHKKLKTRGQEVGEAIQKYGQLTDPIGSAVGMLQPQVKSLAKIIGQVISVFGSALNKTEDINAIRVKVNTILASSGKRVVVVIDDIDRLDKDEVHQVFKLVKNVAHFKNVSYLLSFDRVVVAEALSERYPNSPSFGGSFIDKIVQLPLFVPSVDQLLLNRFLTDDLDRIISQNKLDITEKDMSRFQSVFFARDADKLFDTPRKVVRYLNTVDFSTESLGIETCFTDTALIDLIRNFYPDLYESIASNKLLLLNGMHGDREIENEKAAARKAVFGTDKPFAMEAMLIRELFPSFEWALGGSSYSGDFLKIWEDEKRVCSEKYFNRFFAYDIPVGDVADAKIDSFLLTLSSPKTTIPIAEKAFKDMSKNSDQALLLSKLRRKEDDLTETVSKKLSQVMVNVGFSLSRQRQALVGDMYSPYVQSAILAIRLTRNIQNPYKTLEKYIKSSPIDYAAQLFNWIRVNTEKDKTTQEDFEPLITLDELDNLGKLIANRIKTYTNTKYIQTDLTQDVPFLMWIWQKWGNKSDINNYFAKSFKNNPERAVDFLMTYVGDAWEIGTGIKTRSEFRREAYDQVAKVVDPEVFIKPLMTLYGKEVNEGGFSDSRFDKTKDYKFQVAQQFLYINRNKDKVDSNKAAGTEAIEGEVVDTAI